MAYRSKPDSSRAQRKGRTGPRPGRPWAARTCGRSSRILAEVLRKAGINARMASGCPIGCDCERHDRAEPHWIGEREQVTQRLMPLPQALGLDDGKARASDGATRQTGE